MKIIVIGRVKWLECGLCEIQVNSVFNGIWVEKVRAKYCGQPKGKTCTNSIVWLDITKISTNLLVGNILKIKEIRSLFLYEKKGIAYDNDRRANGT